MIKSRFNISLILHTIGIYIFFIQYGIYQEKIATTPYDGKIFRNTFFMSFIQSISGFFMSYIASLFTKKSLALRHPNPLPKYFRLSLLQLLGGQLAYRSLQYMNYPTLIIGKSCKLIPIALMNFLLYKKKFAIRKYASILLTTAGVLSFMIFEDKSVTTKKSSLTGLLFLLSTLGLDGVINSWQDNLFDEHRIHSYHMMFYANVFNLLNTMLILISPFCSQLKDSMVFIKMHPQILYDMGMYSLCHVFGQLIIYSMIERHGTVMLATINISRKIFSIMFSLFWFKHSLNYKQWISILTIITSFSMELMEKSQRAKML